MTSSGVYTLCVRSTSRACKWPTATCVCTRDGETAKIRLLTSSDLCFAARCSRSCRSLACTRCTRGRRSLLAFAVAPAQPPLGCCRPSATPLRRRLAMPAGGCSAPSLAAAQRWLGSLPSPTPCGPSQPPGGPPAARFASCLLASVPPSQARSAAPMGGGLRPSTARRPPAPAAWVNLSKSIERFQHSLSRSAGFAKPLYPSSRPQGRGQRSCCALRIPRSATVGWQHRHAVFAIAAGGSQLRFLTFARVADGCAVCTHCSNRGQPPRASLRGNAKRAHPCKLRTSSEFAAAACVCVSAHAALGRRPASAAGHRRLPAAQRPAAGSQHSALLLLARVCACAHRFAMSPQPPCSAGSHARSGCAIASLLAFAHLRSLRAASSHALFPNRVRPTGSALRQLPAGFCSSVTS